MRKLFYGFLLSALLSTSCAAGNFKGDKEYIPDFSEASLPVLNQALRDLYNATQNIETIENNYYDIINEVTRTINYLKCYNVKDYGAVGNGTTDDTAAVRAAVVALESNNGGTLYFPTGTYLITDSIYLDDAETSFTYYIKGDGKGSVLKPSKASQFYIFVLNETSLGAKVITFPAHPRAVFSDLKILGTGSTAYPSFLWYNEASFRIEKVLAYDLQYLVTGTGYTDNVSLSDIYWQTGCTDDTWIYKQGGNGDGFTAERIFCGDMPAIFLKFCASGTILDVINGRYTFEHCHSVTVKNGHFEETDTDHAITNIGSNIIIEDSYFNCMLTYEPIALDEDTSYNCKQYTVLRNNTFATTISTATTTTVSAIKLEDFGARSSLRLEGNRGLVWATGRGIWEPLGFTITATDATLNTYLATNKRWLTGNVELYYGYRYPGGVQWVLEGTSTDGRNINDNIKATDIYMADPGSMYCAQTEAYSSNLAADTYYYIAAFIVGSKTTDHNTEESVAVSDNKSVVMTFTTAAHAVLRVWRGTATNTYDNYVDIPCVAGYFEFYDTGATLSGYPWIAAGIPALPTANTTTNKETMSGEVEFNANTTVNHDSADAFIVEDSGTSENVLHVNTTTGSVGVNTNTTTVAGLTADLCVSGNIGILGADADSKNFALQNATSLQAWNFQHEGTGAANALKIQYFDGNVTWTTPLTLSTAGLLTVTGTEKINANSTTALLVEQDGVKDNTLLVNTTAGSVGVASALTSVAGLSPALVVGGDVAVVAADASSKNILLSNGTGNQTWDIQHKGSGASNAFELGYYDGANWTVPLSLSTAGALTTLGVHRTTTSLYRRYYHFPMAAANPAASGATWTDMGANNLSGWQLNAATEFLHFQSDIHSDWDGASDLTVEIKWALLDGGNNNDTVDLKLQCRYMSVGDAAAKTQAIAESATVTTGQQYRLYQSTFVIDYNPADNLVDAGDVISFVLNLETDTSEVDNIVVIDGSFSYLTTHTYVEAGDV